MKILDRNITLAAALAAAVPLLTLVCAALPAAAQTTVPKVYASVEPDSIMIGDRFTLNIEVEKDLVQTILFPTFAIDPREVVAEEEGDGAAYGGAEPGIECIAELPVDTLVHDGRRIRIRKRYVMAAFDEGRYALGRARVMYADKNIVDTLYSGDSLYLAVATFQIDSTSHPIFDIKPQRTMPFRFGEISGYLLWSLLALALLAAAVYGLARWMAAHGRRLTDMFKPAPPLPPHVVAIAALEELHNKKLWQNNRHKLYYSGLSDILRTYIAGRYGVGAMEMTTDEIVAAMRGFDIPPKSAMDLVAVLRDADLVKFAKAMPEADENEDAYTKSYYFVEETKPLEIPDDGDDDDAAPAADKKDGRGR